MLNQYPAVGCSLNDRVGRCARMFACASVLSDRRAAVSKELWRAGAAEVSFRLERML